MDEGRFREADEAYRSGDFRAAAKGFLASAGRGQEGNGVAYHKAGNSLMRLRRYADAATVYGHALSDEDYERRGTVWANLGTAQAASGEYGDAVHSYRRALEEPGYDTDHKALQGMAGALWEMGRFEDAALAYRQAALDVGNPDPGKALNNLGLTMMRLDKPEEAIEAYKAALDQPEYGGKGKAAANLGIAYAAVGKHADAVKAFERAVSMYGHRLAAETRAVQEASLRSVTGRGGEREVVDGWVTGESPPVIEEGSEPGTPGPMPYAVGLENVPAQGPAAISVGKESAGGSEVQADEELADFFNRSDAEMRERDRATRRVERETRRVERPAWRGILTFVVPALLLAGVASAAYGFGLGHPSQSSTVRGMLEARSDGESVERFWVAVPEKDIEKEMAKVPASFQEFAIQSIARSASSSTVEVTVTLERGAPLHLKIAMAREGVGWKVTGVENDWRSTGGGS